MPNVINFPHCGTFELEKLQISQNNPAVILCCFSYGENQNLLTYNLNINTLTSNLFARRTGSDINIQIEAFKVVNKTIFIKGIWIEDGQNYPFSLELDQSLITLQPHTTHSSKGDQHHGSEIQNL